MSVEKNVPEIRFKGFSGEWVEHKLQDLTENGFSNGVFNDPQKVGKGYRLINVKDMYSGDCIDVDGLSLVDVDEKEFKNNKVQYGDIFFTRSSLVKEGIAYSNVNLSDRSDLTFDGHLIRMQPCKATTDPVFLASLFKTSSARKQLILGGKTTTMTTIGQSDIAIVELALPEKQEQTAIGKTFQKLDNLIKQHQQKHDKLNSIKKAMLEKMFPKQGETTPEIRFKGFSGEWEEKPLKKVASDITDGNWIESEHIFESGEFRIIQTGNIGIGQYLDRPKHAKFFHQLNFDSVRGNEIYQGDILISRLADPAGRTAILPDTGYRMVTAVDVAIVRPEPSFDSYFLMTLLNMDQTLKAVAEWVSGTSHKRISHANLVMVGVIVPCVEEQTSIGNYFQKLDALINQHQQQITKLNNIKQACLSKMFV